MWLCCRLSTRVGSSELSRISTTPSLPRKVCCISGLFSFLFNTVFCVHVCVCTPVFMISLIIVYFLCSLQTSFLTLLLSVCLFVNGSLAWFYAYCFTDFLSLSLSLSLVLFLSLSLSLSSSSSLPALSRKKEQFRLRSSLRPPTEQVLPVSQNTLRVQFRFYQEPGMGMNPPLQPHLTIVALTLSSWWRLTPSTHRALEEPFYWTRAWKRCSPIGVM